MSRKLTVIESVIYAQAQMRINFNIEITYKNWMHTRENIATKRFYSRYFLNWRNNAQKNENFAKHFFCAEFDRFCPICLIHELSKILNPFNECFIKKNINHKNYNKFLLEIYSILFTFNYYIYILNNCFNFMNKFLYNIIIIIIIIINDIWSGTITVSHQRRRCCSYKWTCWFACIYVM